MRLYSCIHIRLFLHTISIVSCTPPLHGGVRASPFPLSGPLSCGADLLSSVPGRQIEYLDDTKPGTCGLSGKGMRLGLKCKVVYTSVLGFKIPQSSCSEASRRLTEPSGAIFQQKNMRALRSAGRKSLLQAKRENTNFPIASPRTR